jgi:hypothetical protein
MNKWLLMLLFVPLLFSSCRDDDSQGSSSGGQVTAHFSLSVAGLKSSGGSTRSIDPTTVSESTVNNLWVLQFQGATLVSKTYYSAIDPTAFDTKLTSGLSNIYFVANAGSSAFTTFTIGTTTETTFQSTTKSLSAETDVLTSSTYIPMEGSLTGVTVPSTGYMASQTITLTRTLARVTLNYTTSLANFEVRKIRVCNVPKTMQYYPPTSLTTVFPASPSASTVNTYDYTDVSGTNGSCTFYLPENQRSTGTNSTTDVTKKTGVSYATYIELVGYTKGATLGGQEVVYKLYPGADSYNDYNICRNTYYTVTADISGASGADARVTRTPRANCYIVAPGKSVYIPLARANDSDLGTQISDLTASGYTVGVAWQDLGASSSAVTATQSAADRAFGVFKVTAASGYTGNAVVYVKSASNTTLWSWHIWITSYDPDVTNSPIGTYTFMDRNLGATNITPGQAYKGLYYQWGRKDPFPQASTVNSTTFETVYNGSGTSITTVPTLVSNTPTTNNLSNSVLNPTSFYYAGAPTYDWYAATVANQNNGLWGTLKTVYDPCPAGWKVAPSAAYTSTSFSTSTMTNISGTYGWTYTSSGSFWPLSGLLDYGPGTLGNVGSVGYYWSSANSSQSGSGTDLYTTSVAVSVNHSRAYGMSVRCVQDK